MLSAKQAKVDGKRTDGGLACHAFWAMFQKFLLLSKRIPCSGGPSRAPPAHHGHPMIGTLF